MLHGNWEIYPQKTPMVFGVLERPAFKFSSCMIKVVGGSSGADGVVFHVRKGAVVQVHTHGCDRNMLYRSTESQHDSAG